MRCILRGFLSKLKFLFFESPVVVVLISFFAIGYLINYVDLQPHVDTDFFFSSEDQPLRTERRLSSVFPQPSQLIISAQGGDLQSEDYRIRLEVLTKALMAADLVSGVKSITNGPGSYKRALESPLWRRLLVSEDGLSTNLIVFLPPVEPKKIIPEIEKIVADYSAENFELKIAGVPYVVELIRRYLLKDLKMFSIIAFVMFSLTIILIFKSFRVLFGTLITCLDACIFTLIFSQLLGVKIGILTANISTIVFVLTLSHIVFLTNNWIRLGGKTSIDNRTAAKDAVRLTFTASFWCMMTTLLGFASLIFVQAKPLRELGYSGVIGTATAIVAAYGIYPLFLSIGKKTSTVEQKRVQNKHVFVGHYMWATVLMALFAGFSVSGLWQMNTDPSLLSYFKSGEVLRDGMEYIDENGGSSPLNVVVTDVEGRALNTGSAYEKLWKLQEALENDPGVGSVVSLPVLLAEGKRFPLSVFVSFERMLRIMGHKKYEAVSRNFITDDRLKARFFLRMKESARKVSRLEVVERVKGIVVDHGFKVDIVGGIYKLQGEMSRLVISSLIGGLIKLIALFLIIAFIVSLSFKVTFAMVACLSLIPICMLGLIGHLGVPLDIISAPAANVAIGMGIDSMIHMVIAMRRFLAEGNGFWQAWKNARRILWKPIVSSMSIVAAGFGIFSFSMFPPSQRFGLAVVLGTCIAAPIALFVLPSVVGPWFYKD